MICWIRYGETRCDGLDLKSYERDLLPRIRQLAESADKGVRDQAQLLLEDRSNEWLKRKGGG